MFRFLALILCIFSTCWAKPLAANTPALSEIRVQLETQSPLDAIYIGSILADQPLLPPAYLASIEEILSFDLNYNGYMKGMKRDPAKETALSQKDSKVAFNPALWKSAGVSHAIRAHVSEKKLSVQVYSIATASLKQFPEIALTGTLAEDRKNIHKLADAILRALYGIDGIASSHILFSAQVSSKEDSKHWASEIWECDWDGANAHQITKEGSYCVTPVFLPSRNDRFLYVSYKLGQPKIFIASLKEGKGQRLIEIRGNQLLPAISPQRDMLAFICDAGGRSDLFIQPFHPEKGEVGKPYQLYSYPRATQASPTFSPDGKRIAFVSDKDGSPRIYTLSTQQNAKRSEPILISKENKESSCPSWSPDGTKLAYSAKTKGVRQIWIYDFEKGEEMQLTYGPGNKENPNWAQDSLHLVFNSTDGHSCELYLINLHQPEAVKISHGSGKKHYPTWGGR
jgi:TolB protein